MTPKSPTKEELIAKVAQLELSLQEQEKLRLRDQQAADSTDQVVRTELSVALGAPYKKKGYYDDLSEQITYSWFEVFREIGKLLATKNDSDMRTNIEVLRQEVSMLRRDFEKSRNPEDNPF